MLPATDRNSSWRILTWVRGTNPPTLIAALAAITLSACSVDDPLLAGGGRAPSDAGEDAAGEDASIVDGPGGGGHGGSPSTLDPPDDSGLPPPHPFCPQANAIELRARRAIVSDDPNANPDNDQGGVITITKSGLYGDFQRNCGNVACHGGADEPLEQSPNPFKMTLDSFDQRPNLGTQALARILNEDASKTMPPGTGVGAERTANDPLRILGENLKRWEDEGFPDHFDIVIEGETGGVDLGNPYLLGTDLADSLTNLGSCVPVASIEREVDEMQELDQMFAGAATFDDLPETLAETDLVSLDSQVLAGRGVYSYAPTYMLFSDNAEKMRYVRVPVGTSITYNEETREFDVPENTRFYKTFLRKVIDKDGEVGYRKMETRLIVSRKNEQLPDGSFRPRALKVVYAWDYDEQMARKVTDPLRNGQPWSDRLCPYVTDETESRDPPAPEDGGAPLPVTNPIIENVSSTCTYMTQDELDDGSSGKIRHYAIPSIERCDQCHMGSHSDSYILGFTPYHADRREAGEGGIFEDPEPDEVDQLARLIEYGVVKGIEPGEAKLEESQGERVPRNDYELKAQGYMMGNCSFCHNPHGFPTVQNPILKDFDMFPSETGGVFQFPLEKYSPRAKFGIEQRVRFPYITPGFGNHPGGTSLTSSKQFSVGELAPVVDLVKGVTITGIPTWVVENGAPDIYFDRFERGPDGYPLPPVFTYLAPWRSLIWRNVSTPFTYSEDNAIFIHMPRNVPGFDCRAHQIMADWMLSIPAKDCSNSNPKLPPVTCEAKEAARLPGEALNLDQPYEEILPDAREYEKAVRDGQKRVDAFHASVMGQQCPIDDDIVDPQVLNSPPVLGSEKKQYPAPNAQPEGAIPTGPRVVNDLYAWPIQDGIPDHAHWVPVDTTDNFAAGWIPRRSNWKSVIAERTVTVSPQLNRVIDQLQGIYLSDQQKDFSLRPVPMGMWGSACAESASALASPTVVEMRVSGLQRGANDLEDLTNWIFEPNHDGSPLPAFGHVHSQSRGQAVFQAICQNCHGRQADSRSPLATTIGELTGGETRVANFVDGIFGPKPAPGIFAEDTFRINYGATPADWQIRYMLFMGLGGTEATIPEIAVALVKTSPFYGSAVVAGNSTGANMLEAASGKCNEMLHTLWEVRNDHTVHPGNNFKFLLGTGEYELWEALCSYDNEPIVRVLSPSSSNLRLFDANIPLLYRAKDDSGAWVYPADHAVGNRLGKYQKGIQPDNFLPWCVRTTPAFSREQLEAVFEAEGVHESMMPICPDELFAKAFGGKEIYRLEGGENSFDNSVVVERVNRRGAMNAGIAAYYYLDGLTKGTFPPAQGFDTCEAAP